MLKTMKAQRYIYNYNFWVNKGLIAVLFVMLIIASNAAHWMQSIDNEYTPGITKLHAVNIAKNSYGVKSITQINNPHVQLAIKPYDQADKLVYVVNFLINNNQLRHPFFVIDAMNGDLLEQWEGVV